VTLHGKHYFARQLRQSSLKDVNPFRLVADGPGRGEANFGRMTIAVVPSTRRDGEGGFICWPVSSAVLTTAAVIAGIFWTTRARLELEVPLMTSSE
jgi:CDP-diacylglycerol pyrophosphatase